MRPSTWHCSRGLLCGTEAVDSHVAASTPSRRPRQVQVHFLLRVSTGAARALCQCPCSRMSRLLANNRNQNHGSDPRSKGHWPSSTASPLSSVARAASTHSIARCRGRRPSSISRAAARASPRRSSGLKVGRSCGFCGGRGRGRGRRRVVVAVLDGVPSTVVRTHRGGDGVLQRL